MTTLDESLQIPHDCPTFFAVLGHRAAVEIKAVFFFLQLLRDDLRSVEASLWPRRHLLRHPIETLHCHGDGVPFEQGWMDVESRSKNIWEDEQKGACRSYVFAACPD